jgi:hypothetical protein
MRKAMRVCSLILRVAILGALVTWVLCAPLVWILRDGLGPDSVESGWTIAAYRFTVMWGGPALALAVPLIGLSLLEGWLGNTQASRASNGAHK